MENKDGKITFHLIHKEGIDVKLQEKNLNVLLDKYFADREKLKEEVEKIVWKIKSTVCIYNPINGEIERKIKDGDVNPYGWRMKHG